MRCLTEAINWFDAHCSRPAAGGHVVAVLGGDVGPVPGEVGRQVDGAGGGNLLVDGPGPDRPRILASLLIVLS